MSDIADRKKLWRPDPRPEWVQRINEEGYCMNIRGIVPLDPDSLIASARLSTGLSDFGAEDWREPFQALAYALDGEEAALNLMGRIRSRSELLMMLEARLRIEDAYKRHPEIDDEQIVQPFIVVGQGRAGTSFLVNTLGANPENGVIKHWEAMFPCPPPEAESYARDPRSARGHELIDQWNRVTPKFK
ncbi:MAG: sulfotransferase, partial [Rhizobiaceae bacterium]